MNCRETCNLIPEYITHRLSAEELKPFLEHMHSCEDCQEELEFNYILKMGLNEENDDFSQYNIKKMESQDLRFSVGRVKKRRAVLSVKYALSTAAFWSIVLCMVMQAKMILWR